MIRSQSGKRSQAVHDLNRLLELPDSTLGQLDWSTGILRINTDTPSWQAWRQNPTGNLPLFATLVHEAQHALQISLCGDLFRTSLYFYGIAEQIHARFPDASDYPDSLDGVLDDDTLEFTRDRAWDLTYVGEGDVSLLQIVEGVTHLTEQRIFSNDYDTHSYLEYLPYALVGETYTHAFKRFYELSGQHEQTIWYFPPACHLALCSQVPQRSFCAMAEALSQGRVGQNDGIDRLYDICRQNDDSFIGWSWEWAETNPHFRHPFFDRLRTRLQSASHEEEFHRYVIRPDQDITLTMAALEQPTILNPVADPEVDGFREWPTMVWHWEGEPSNDEKAREVRRISKLANISRKYMASFGNPPPNVRRSPA